jgi:galactose oxidase-like protein/glyoxal oxidase-like protein
MGGFLVQSSHGGKGNFEVVVPRSGGGLAHWWRNNDHPKRPWSGPKLMFGSTEDVDAAALIQGNFGKVGNLEVVVNAGGSLYHYWRDDGGTWDWHAGKGKPVAPVATGVVGAFGLVQSSHGTTGNFEVVAPHAGGGLAHWWRDNDGASVTWHGPTKFGSGSVGAAALIQSNFGSFGNLEVVALVDDQLVHWWRDDGGTWKWTKGATFGTGVAGPPALVQSSHGAKGNFEVVAPLTAGGLGHWWRGGDGTWHGPSSFGSGSVRAVAMIQGSLGSLGNLEVVALVDDELVHWWRDDGGTWKWTEQARLALEPVCDQADGGQHAPPFSAEIVGIHAAVLRTRKVVLFGYSDTDAHVAVSRVLEPISGALQTPPESHHLFCSGHSLLGDGRLLVAGGHHHEVDALHTFDPDQQTWTRVGQMANGRWYPTCTTLPDGRALIISGTKNHGGPVGPGAPVNNTLQRYDPASGIEPEEPLPAPFSNHFPPAFTTIDLYPFVYVLPSGKLLVHSRNTTRLYDLNARSWEATQLPTEYPWSRTYPGEGTSVLLPLLPTTDPPYRARVLVLGGGGADPEQLTPSTPANKTAEILDLGAAHPAWRFTAPMAKPRVMPDAVLLPDGTVAVVGGSSTGRADFGVDPVLAVELFDPVSEHWSTVCPMRVPRSYHATALLLPDARVLMMGKDGLFNKEPYNYPEHRAEIFSPPYLFHGPRPTIAAAPQQVPYDTAFDIDTPDAAEVGSVVLLRAGAVTHSFNMDQRHVGLTINGRAANRLTVTSPPNGNIAPPGFYMLFIVGKTGVPSVAQFMRL